MSEKGLDLFSINMVLHAQYTYTCMNCSTANRLERPAGRHACNGGKITLYRKFNEKCGGGGITARQYSTCSFHDYIRTSNLYPAHPILWHTRLESMYI